MASLSSVVESECTVYVTVLRLRSDTNATSFFRQLDMLLLERTISNASFKCLPHFLCSQSLLDYQHLVNAQLSNVVDSQLHSLADAALRQCVSLRSAYVSLSQFEREQLSESSNVHLIVHTVDSSELHQSNLRHNGNGGKAPVTADSSAARFYPLEFVSECAATIENGDFKAAGRDRPDSAVMFRCDRATRILVRVMENWLRERVTERGFSTLLFSPRCRNVSAVVNNPAYSNLFIGETIEQHAASRGATEDATARYTTRRVTNAEVYNRLANADRCDRVVVNQGFGDRRVAEHMDQCDRFVANPRFSRTVGLSYTDQRLDSDAMRPNFGVTTSLRDESHLATVFSWLREYASLEGDVFLPSESEGDLSLSIGSSVRGPHHSTFGMNRSRSDASQEMLPIYICDKMMVTRVPLYEGADTSVAQLFGSLLTTLGVPLSSAHLFALRLVEDPADYHAVSTTSRSVLNGPSCEVTGGLQLKFYHKPLRIIQLWPVLRSFLFGSLAEGDAQTDTACTVPAEKDPSPPVHVYLTRSQYATPQHERATNVLDAAVSQLLFRDSVRHYRACFLYPFDRRELFVFAALLLRSTLADDAQFDERRLRAYLTDEKLSYLFPLERLAAEPRRTHTVQRLIAAYKDVNSALRNCAEPSREAEFRLLELCRNLTFYACSFFDADLVVFITPQSESPVTVGSAPEQQAQQQVKRLRVVVGVNDLGAHVLRRHDKLLHCSFRYSVCQFLHDASANAFSIEVFGGRVPVTIPFRETESGDLSGGSQSPSMWRNMIGSNENDPRPFAVIESRQAFLIYQLINKLRAA